MSKGSPVPRRPSTLIGITACQWRRARDRRLQSFELTEEMWSPLLNFGRSDVPMRQGDLTAGLLLDRSAMIRIVTNLEAAGLVTRVEGKPDRRAKRLTPSSRDVGVREVEAIASELQRGSLADFPLAQIEMVRSVITKFCAALLGQTKTAGK